MMTPLSDKEMEERLKAAGSSLLQPPSSVDELLTLLDQTEELLSKVEQSPGKSMQTALSPLMKALIKEKLLKHSDVDVRVGVASCISEITRITAPDAPYDDDKMKDVFQLIVSSFENIADTSSRSHDKRATILETVAKVRSCVIMLDLECDQMIIEMFQHFLKAIRDDHAEVIFSSMETIMTLVLEESEDLSPDLVNPILATLKRNNEDAMPIAKKLAERVVQSCADRLRAYLTQAIKALGASVDDYNEVVASVLCENDGTVGRSNDNTFKDQLVVNDGAETNPHNKDLTGNRSPRSTVTNGVNETGTEETMTDANYTTRADANNPIDGKSMSKTESDLDAQIPAKLEAEVEHGPKRRGQQFNSNSDSEESSDLRADLKQAEQGPCNLEISGEDVLSVPSEVPPVEPAISSDKINDSSIQLSPSEAQGDEGVNIASPTQSDSLPEQNLSKKFGRAKRKEILVGEGTLTGDTVSKKVAEEEHVSEAKKVAEEEHVSEAKKQRPSVKKKAKEITVTDKKLTGGGCNNDGGTTSDSEKMLLDKKERQDDADNKSNDGSPAREKDGKKSARSKYRSEKDVPKSSTGEDDRKRSGKKKPEKPTIKDKALTGGGRKNDGGSTSDSEKRSLDQTEKLDDADNKSDSGSPAREKDGKKSGRSKYRSEKDVPKSSTGEDDRKRSGKKKPNKPTIKDKALTGGGRTNDGGSASDSEKRSLDQTEKLGDADNKSDADSPAREDDAKKSGRSKYRSEKVVPKSSKREDDRKDTVTSPRSPLKSTKDESNDEETPRMSTKRKRTPGTGKASDTIEYGENLVGSKVKVWWPKDRMFYEGVIISFDSAKKKHKVSYTDGDEEVLNLKRERLEFVDDPVSDGGQDVEDSSHDDSSDMPRKKKGSNSEAPSKHVKMENSAKSKSKDTATKSSGKFKDDDKAEANTKASNSKSSRKSGDDNSKSKDRLQKVGGKSHDDSAKDDAAKTPSHSKQDSQRTAKAIGKTPQSGKSSGGMAKPGSSKVKETTKMKEKTVDSTKSADVSKGKSPAATKSRESETKSGKKRRR